MKTEHDIENILNSSKPTLDQASRARLWSRIESKLTNVQAVPSPFLFTYIPRQALAPLLIVVILVSTGGVALASEASRPGDLLYPVDRAIESARLKVIRNEDKKNALVRAYSEERLSELRAIIEEESRGRTLSRGDETSITETGDIMSLQIEAEVFKDVTVLKMELNDKKTIFTTPGDTESEITTAVLARFPMLSEEQVLSALDIEYEDRGSRPKDRGEVALSEKGSVRVGSALTEVVSFIDEREDDDDARFFFREIADEIHGLNIKLDDDQIQVRGTKQRFEWKMEKNDEDDGDDDKEKRIEYWEGSSRVRIGEKDGEVRIDVKESDDEGDAWDDDWYDDKDDERDDTDEDDEDTDDDDDKEDREED